MFSCKTKFNLKNRTCKLCFKDFKPTGVNQKFCNNCQKITRKTWEKEHHTLIYTRQRRIKKQFNFHPYAFELANLVREGYLKRKIALERIHKIEDPETVRYIQNKLGIII